MAETEIAQHDPFASGSRHVLGSIGLTFERLPGERHDEPAPAGLSLGAHRVLLDQDGHVGFGALGILFDMASSTVLDPSEFVPFVHADITVHRLRPPQGAMTARARMARRGRRTGVVVIDLHDQSGSLVAASTQEIVFKGPRPEATPQMTRMRESFRAMFDGTCRLTRPLEDELGITSDAPGSWSMDLGHDRTNGFGGLHGGAATTLIDVAAAGAVTAKRGRPARTRTMAARYLAPALDGPFRAVPELLADDGVVATVRIPVVDAGGQTVILADVQVA